MQQVSHSHPENMKQHICMLLFSHLESLRKVVRCQSILLQSKGENVHREEEMLGCLEEELRVVLKGGHAISFIAFLGA